MNGTAKPLVKYMDGSDTRFIIPVYQRNYDWKLENCEQLFNDLVKVIEQKRETHFFGSIVSVASTKGSSSENLIIDGQQRITTISLLFLAVVNLLKQGKILSDQINLGDRIQNTYLIDPYLPGEKKVKLKPIKDDQDAFEKLFDSPDDFNNLSNVTRNYRYFYNRINEKKELSADELFNAICSLIIIDISLDPIKDDAQLIFESLNSTGLELSEGDKIRNFILMGQSSEKQEQLYYNYWNKIEKYTDFNVSDFIRHYLTAKLSKTPAMKEVYISFKNYVEKNEYDKEELLAEILKYAKYYQEINGASSNNSSANIVIGRLNILDMGVSIPYLLNLWEYRANKKISEKEFEDVLFTLEIYIFRRLICDVPTNALNKIFCMLHKDCIKYDTEDVSYSEILKYVLNSKASSGRMPKDTEFINSFSEKDMYSLKAKNKWYLFDRLENMDTVERTNVIKMMQDGIFTVEHIMPQTLSPHWKKDLGEKYQEIHDTWINRIANLTLTGYNSYYSNRPFREKVEIEKGFKDSHLQINSMLIDYKSWTEMEIKQRNTILQSKALRLWPYPKSTFMPDIAINEIHSLDEDYNFKGRNIVSFSFFDTQYTSAAWSDMYLKVVKLLFELEPNPIIQMVSMDATNGFESNFGSSSGDNYSEVSNGIFLWMHNNTMAKINNLKKLFELYDLDLTDLVFEIASEGEDE